MKRTDILLLGEMALWIGLQIARVCRLNALDFDSELPGRVADEYRERFNARDRNPEAL